MFTLSFIVKIKVKIIKVDMMKFEEFMHFCKDFEIFP
jgi:hypothetical protein